MGILLSVCLLTVLLTNVVTADNSRVIIDKETGVLVHYVTSEPCANVAAYPTSRTWSRDGKSIFFESNRARPDGTRFPKERQLLKANIDTGEVTHLAVLESEDTKPYGKAQITLSSQYHFDYAPEADVLVYYDVTGHNLYLINATTGKSSRIWHEADGTIGDPPSISPDGKRIAFYVMYPAIPNRFLGNMTSVVFTLDIDPVDLKAVADPKVMTVYPSRIIESRKELMPAGVFVNHCQLNPKDPDNVCYAHQLTGLGDGTLTLVRAWQNKGGIDTPVYAAEAGKGPVHEVIGPLGKSLYMVDRGIILKHDLKTGRETVIVKDPSRCSCHITVSHDEKWIASDVFDSREMDKDGCFRSGILLINASTGKSKMVCRTKRGKGHPFHPHPVFSEDGNRIAFTAADGPNTSQVAYVDISEMKKNWNSR